MNDNQRLIESLRETIVGLRKKLSEANQAHEAALECCRKEYARRVKAENKWLGVV